MMRKAVKYVILGKGRKKPYFQIFAMKENKMLCQGCIRYWCFAMAI